MLQTIVHISIVRPFHLQKLKKKQNTTKTHAIHQSPDVQNNSKFLCN